MNELSIKLDWQRTEAELTPGKYTNSHSIMYNDDNKVIVDAAPDWGGNIEHTNPEQALAAALSSCLEPTVKSNSPRPNADWSPKFSVIKPAQPSAKRPCKKVTAATAASLSKSYSPVS